MHRAPLFRALVPTVFTGVVTGVLPVGCAPPPLPEVADSGEASSEELPTPIIRFIFPTSSLPGPVCPSFLVAVDIDHFEVVEPDPDSAPVAGLGHWHLDDDITGDYYPQLTEYAEVTARLDGQESRAYRMTASLVNVDHSPLSQTEAPQSIATVEFDVADTSDCLGGVRTAR